MELRALDPSIGYRCLPTATRTTEALAGTAGTRAGFDIRTGAVLCEAENCLCRLYAYGLLNADGPTARSAPVTPRYAGWPPARDPESGGGGEVIARGHDVLDVRPAGGDDLRPGVEPDAFRTVDVRLAEQ